MKDEQISLVTSRLVTWPGQGYETLGRCWAAALGILPGSSARPPHTSTRQGCFAHTVLASAPHKELSGQGPTSSTPQKSWCPRKNSHQCYPACLGSYSGTEWVQIGGTFSYIWEGNELKLRIENNTTHVHQEALPQSPQTRVLRREQICLWIIYTDCYSYVGAQSLLHQIVSL